MNQLIVIWLFGFLHWIAYPMSFGERLFSAITVGLTAGILLGGWTA